MVDQAGGGGGSDDFNPYEPGDAAVDPERQQEQSVDGEMQIAPTTPPRSPKVSRAMENFSIVLDGAFGAVGGGWLVVFFGNLIFGGSVGLVAALAGSGLDAAGMSAQASGGVMILMLPVIAIGVLGLGSLFVGLTRALRKVAFGGPRAISGVGGALSTALERFWSILGMILAWGLVLLVPTGAIGVVAGQAETPELMVVAMLVVFVLAVLLSPLFYVVPATNLGIGGSFSKAVEVVSDNLGYVALCFVAMIGAALAVGCVVGLLQFITIIGTIIGFFINIAMQFFMWVAYVTMFATIEEARGPFDSTASPPSMDDHGVVGGPGGPGAGDDAVAEW